MALTKLYVLRLRLGEVLSFETGRIDDQRLVIWGLDGKGAKFCSAFTGRSFLICPFLQGPSQKSLLPILNGCMRPLLQRRL